jgi:hypothetical protein
VVLGVGLRVVGVGGREEPPERLFVGILVEKPLEDGGKRAKDGTLSRAQDEQEVTGRSGLERSNALPQSCRIVAQRPYEWSRETSCSAFSRVPDETTAFPSWCTWSMSSVAFSRL